MQEISRLDENKTTANGDIPVKILKICSDIISPFPNGLKLADVKPALKKDDTTKKSNYRPISILPSVSKIFERNVFNQILVSLCGFRKHYNTQNDLMAMIEK